MTKLVFTKKETIGMIGPYTTKNLPQEILNKISRGLTKVEKDGKIKPDLAEKWKIAPNGKGYAFYLKKNLYFSDGTPLTAKNITYDFENVTVAIPDDFTIVYTLKDNYSPFLTTVSRPILKNGLIGVGDYKVKKIKLNGDFVESIELFSEKHRKTFIYELFYPTTESLKDAFVLGEISKMTNLPDLSFKNTDFKTFKNTNVEKKVDYSKLVTLFYNTKDSFLSSKPLREGLSYAIPNQFKEGQRNPDPYPTFSYVFQAGNSNQQDLEHAKLLIEKSETATGSSKLKLKIDTLPKYKNIAKQISEIWKKINIETEIKVINQIPENFQIFLGDFNPSTDPDQYVLWHSSQITNITHYDNKRIDKLLEDGRKELNIEKRVLIYNDFQKYLATDPPASFLFFPYYFEVSRK